MTGSLLATISSWALSHFRMDRHTLSILQLSYCTFERNAKTGVVTSIVEEGFLGAAKRLTLQNVPCAGNQSAGLRSCAAGIVLDLKECQSVGKAMPYYCIQGAGLKLEACTPMSGF